MIKSVICGVLRVGVVRVRRQNILISPPATVAPGQVGHLKGFCDGCKAARLLNNTVLDQAIAKVSGNTSEPISGLGGVRNEIRQPGGDRECVWQYTPCQVYRTVDTYE